MKRFQSIVAWCLALFTVFLVSCGSGETAQAPTYDEAQIEQIQDYAAEVVATRDRIEELESLIEEREWIDIDSLIHGPLGNLRRSMSKVSRNLLPADREAAQQAAKDLFGHLEAIDRAAEERKYAEAVRNYENALVDFDRFLKQIPGNQALQASS
jgi:photosystem II protein PsbQ